MGNKNSEWDKLTPFCEMINISTPTIIKCIKKRKFPEEIAYYDYGKDDCGHMKRYYINTPEAIKYMINHPNQFGGLTVRRKIKKLEKKYGKQLEKY